MYQNLSPEFITVKYLFNIGNSRFQKVQAGTYFCSKHLQVLKEFLVSQIDNFYIDMIEQDLFKISPANIEESFDSDEDGYLNLKIVKGRNCDKSVDK